jgi:hypothetical protein
MTCTATFCPLVRLFDGSGRGEIAPPTPAVYGAGGIGDCSTNAKLRSGEIRDSSSYRERMETVRRNEWLTDHAGPIVGRSLKEGLEFSQLAVLQWTRPTPLDMFFRKPL